jgi:hypothetical protein
MMKKTPDATDLIALGTKDPRYGGGYKPTGILYSDLKADILGDGTGCLPQFNFKPGSVGEKVSFRKASGANPVTNRDIIIPNELEIARSNGGGIYNFAVETSFNGGISPENTFWNTQYLDPTNTSWAPVWDIENRTYDTWQNAIETPEGSSAPPQYVGMPTVMKYDNGSDPARYWLILFTEWGVGAYDEYGFAYDRYEIFPAVTFTRPDDRFDIRDIISPGVHIARESNQGQIFNIVNEPEAQTGVSPRNTRWNSIYTDARPNYSGFTDLSNLESRVYTDFALALDGNVGNNIIGTDLIMHDLTTDLYYKVVFADWTSGGNGGGFEYTRTVIPQSCQIKFADGSVMNTASASSSGAACCPVLDVNNNLIIDDNSTNTVSLGPGEPQRIPDFSGMLLVNDHFSGRVETWIAGSGDAALLGYTDLSSGIPTSTVTQNGNGYEWTNNDNLVGPFTFTVIKTRNGA